jgi:hypothetical protein
MFYMRPSRYYPHTTPTHKVIDNLVYCMNTMLERSEKACTEGIGFLANMDDWHMENFSISYCYQFMMVLQGRIPARVRLFLIVNPPAWFGRIWKLMKPMLAYDFRQKVHMIHEPDLEAHLMPGYTAYLPDDVKTGTVSTDDLVVDFVTYRKSIEGTPTATPAAAAVVH